MESKIRYIVSVVIILISGMISERGYSQNVEAAIVAGLNVSTVHGDGFGGYHKAGFNPAIAAYVPIAEKFNISMEIGYTQKGSVKPINSPINEHLPGTHLYKLKMDYVEVPILVNFVDQELMMFGVGVAYSRLMRFYEEINFTENIFQEPPASKRDWALVFNAIYLAGKHFGINLRYSASLFSVMPAPPIPDSFGHFNRVISFRLMYFL